MKIFKLDKIDFCFTYLSKDLFTFHINKQGPVLFRICILGLCFEIVKRKGIRK